MQNTEDHQLPEPHHIEAEQAVLGACLLEATALDVVADILVHDDFFLMEHVLIYRTLLAMRDEGVPIDPVELSKRLSNRRRIQKVGGVQYLRNLEESCPTASNVDHYALIVKEKAQLRLFLLSAKEVAAGVYDGATVEELIEKQHRTLNKIQSSNVQGKKDFRKSSDVLAVAIEQIEERYYNRNLTGRAITGIPTGYADLDEMLAGLQRSDLIILAARPAVGKTAFALNLAQNVAVRARQNVAVFSLEMSAEQLVQRMLCAEGNIDAGKLRTGDLSDDDWIKLSLAVGTIGDAPLFIDDTPGITISEIRAKCKRLVEEEGDLALIVIDYLQLISGRGGNNRVQEVSEISRQLKLLARELNVTVVALSQLSRSVESRQDKRPMLSDLRESGSIEQDADIVSFLYRDDYYNPESEKRNVVEFIIAKQRSGPTGTVEIVFLKNYNKFVNLKRDPQVVMNFEGGASS
ncbi:replicative DNA helicase [Tumebacillus sp. ITR2]|uniref:Replicative DNA helicase n=1 Tax=Tumebacillus amylolyticus TaxID=2801339 RepID=A0ABS1JC75_9BACL|nr:replicative DNA helicase [Tumebacillus amylolyticus]MBL0387880.1 replicative DNA helicase [Tumebacillus amylolyticus]